MSYRNPVRIQLNHNHNSFTNLDEISGQVILSLVTQETVAAITVKLEGESRTRLAGIGGPPGGYDPYARNQTQLEVHKACVWNKQAMAIVNCLQYKALVQSHHCFPHSGRRKDKSKEPVYPFPRPIHLPFSLQGLHLPLFW